MSSLSIDMIHEYLVEVGCKIEYPILVNAFKKHLYNPDPNLQGKIRTQFKDYVNRLATVSLENNMKFINLRPEFVPPHLQQKMSGQHQANMSPQRQDPKQQQPPDKPAHNPPQSNQHQQPAIRQHAVQRSPPRPTTIESRQTVENHRSSINRHQPINSVINQSHIISADLPHHKPMSSPIQSQGVLTGNQNQSHHVVQQQMQQQMQQQAFIRQQYQQHQHSTPLAQQSPRQIHLMQQKGQCEQQQINQVSQSFNRDSTSDKENKGDVGDGNTLSSKLMPPPPTPPFNHNKSHHHRSLSMQQQLNRHDSLNLSTNTSSQQHQQMPPPRPPPRRRQSTASMFKPPIGGVKIMPDENKDSQDSVNHEGTNMGFRKNLAGQVREHALKLSGNTSLSSLSLSTSSSNDLHSKFHSQQHLSVPKRNESLRESTNRLSKDSTAFISGLNTSGLSAVKLQRNGSYLTTRSRSSHRGEDESDSSSLQPTIDPLRRKWAMEACSCNYNGLLTLLREDPKLASYKDIVNGYTALHWAAKFGNLDIIKLIAGTHGVSSNIKSSAGQTPLHVAYMFNRLNAARLLLEIYHANPEIRDHSGKRPMQYFMGVSKKPSSGVNCTNNYNNSCVTPS